MEIFFYFTHSSCFDFICQIFSIITPCFLFFWFLYSQIQLYIKNYCKEISGVYAGFVNQDEDTTEGSKLQRAIKMSIRNINDKGYFLGDLEYGEKELKLANNIEEFFDFSWNGIFSFVGKLDYKFYWNKTRHPLDLSENRKYIGKLFIFSRLDLPFEISKMDLFLDAEYDAFHYREMKVLKFSLKKRYKETAVKMLPREFILYKSSGYIFEPLQLVDEFVFKSKK